MLVNKFLPQDPSYDSYILKIFAVTPVFNAQHTHKSTRFQITFQVGLLPMKHTKAKNLMNGCDYPFSPNMMQGARSC